MHIALVSGGAQVNWAGVGNLLTASFPQDRQTWIARGKDHLQADQATITAVARGFVPVACKGLSIAAYFSPTTRPDLWDKIAASFPATQMIVFGPDNLTGVNADYYQRVQQMHGIGIRVFGYVNTVDTTTGIMIKSEDVKKNIDAYNHLYSVTDIMFDNAETITANIPYYQDLADYVHGQTPGSLVEMNASSSVLGTEEVPEAYMQFDDILAWFEGTYAQYFDPTFPNSKLMSWAKKYPSIRFKNYIHHVPDPSVIPSLLQRLIQNNTAFFHISDQTNPYVDLGTDQFWNALVPVVEATCPP